VSFYKYHIRIKNFYEFRFKALRISGIVDLERIQVFTSVLTKEQVNSKKDDEIKFPEFLELISNQRNDDIGREKFTIMEIYKKIEIMWSVYNMG
jgi:hypothetical protein